MPTPSEPQPARPPRSIFGPPLAAPAGLDEAAAAAAPSRPAPARSTATAASAAPARHEEAPLQTLIDVALGRSFLYRFLAQAFEDTAPDGWSWLTGEPTRNAIRSASNALAARAPGSFAEATDALLRQLTPSAYAAYVNEYVTCFGHTVRGDCPMNEIEYGDIKADPLFQPHRLADLGAFYAAFGLELTADAAERQDHISIELEFMSVLAAKEAYGLEHQLDDAHREVVHRAQRQFLREHLGRWTPAFTRRLARMAGPGPLGAVARFCRECILLDCARFAVSPGSEDLLLRPVDEAGEKLCASCGITRLPPGASEGMFPET